MARAPAREALAPGRRALLRAAPGGGDGRGNGAVAGDGGTAAEGVGRQLGAGRRGVGGARTASGGTPRAIGQRRAQGLGGRGLVVAVVGAFRAELQTRTAWG